MMRTTKDLPGALIAVTVEPRTKSDRERLKRSLQQLMTEDRSFGVSIDREKSRTILSGTSELDLGAIVDRLRREFKIDTKVSRPQVIYKETIRSSVEREAKLVRQAGGHGHYAHVVLRVEPLGNERTFEFVDATKGGVIPCRYITAVESGVAEVMRTGVVYGHPMIDVKVTLLDGSYHEIDSSEMAFKIAGSMAFKEAAALAKPVLLEPLMSVEVVVPEELSGDVLSDLCARRGTIQRQELRGGAQLITAQARLARMFGYAAQLRLITEGRATHTMEFIAYVEADPPQDPGGNEPASVTHRVA